MPLSTIFQLYRGRGNQSTGLLQVTDKLYYIMYRVHLSRAVFKLTILVVIDTDCMVVVNPTTI